MTKLTSLICRGLFVLAFVVAGAGVWEKLANKMGYTIMGLSSSPSRLLGYSAVILLFVVALLLREIRHLLAAKA
jgi:hypothetical protein